MAREMQFFMYLIERYADYKNSTSGDILTLWNELDISKYIYDIYELYHTEARQINFLHLNT